MTYERIKELAKQTSYIWHASGDPQIYEFTPEKLEKFAESIVRECADHCDLLLDHKISSEWSRGTHDCSRAIKKHFGVEE